MADSGLWGSGAWGGATDPSDYPAYAVILGGQGLMLPPGGYQRSLGQQFAAKLSTSGTTENDRLGEQQLVLNDWGGGEGLTRRGTIGNTDRYRRGAGINVYDEDSVVGLGPYMAAPAALQTAFNSVTAMIPYGQYLVLGRDDGKVYRWDGTTLSLAGDTGKTTGGVRAFALAESHLYIGNGQDNAVWRWQGSTLLTNFAANFTINTAAAPFNSSVTGVYAMSEFWLSSVNGNMFVGTESSLGGTVAQYANTAGTATPIFVAQEPKISLLIEFRGALIAVAVNETARRWRLYSMNTSLAWQYLAGPIQDGYITCGAVFNGALYLGDAKRGRIWKWDGSNVTLHRQIGTDVNPYTGSITGMASWRGALWVAIKDEDGTCALLRNDGGTSWSRPVTGLGGTTNGGLVVYADQLHYATQATGAAKLFRTDGTYAASGWIESPMEAANLEATGKLWKGVQVNHSALASGQSVQVQYQLNDGGPWTTLGTSDVDGATDAEFDFPTPVMADQIAFKLILTGSAGSATPLRVFSLAAKYRPAPDALKEWQLKVLLHGTLDTPMPLSDGTTEAMTGEEISETIWEMVADNVPVVYLDIDRQEYTVEITDWSESLAGRSIQLRATTVGWELEGQLKLREVREA